jgi:hypothetical protein
VLITGSSVPLGLFGLVVDLEVEVDIAPDDGGDRDVDAVLLAVEFLRDVKPLRIV